MAPSGLCSTVLSVDSLDVCALAREAGWRHTQIVKPTEMLCGAALLQLAGQQVNVRLVVHTGEDSQLLLERLRQDVLYEFFLEHFIVLVGFPEEAVKAYQAAFQGVTTRRITVGSLLNFRAWLTARLGPLGGMQVSSPVRRLTEHLLCVTSTPEPLGKRPVAASYEGSTIQPSFDLGQLGVQAVETLFAYTRGAAGVLNVEADKRWQTKDVDLLIGESGLGGGRIQVEVKNEDKTTGNLVLEKHSCFERKTPGWLDYSTADVLASCLWPTGDLYLMDFAEVREWVRTTPRKLRLVLGTVPEQSYHSQVYLAPIEALLKDLSGIVHLRLGDWLPRLYEGSFQPRCITPPHLSFKTLRPQRLAWPV